MPPKTRTEGRHGLALDATDRVLCDRLIKNGSRSFFTASLLLPPSVRAAARALYAFCRLSDDLVDAPSPDPTAAVARLRERLQRVYARRPEANIADRAFAAVVEAYDLPRALPLALIEGYAWDASGRDYTTLEDLLDYSARVAGTVGVMMARIMGTGEPEVLARAADLGLAMQLTNIARDVGEDARAGRLYLPTEWLDANDVCRERLLAEPAFTPQIGEVVAHLLKVADTYYDRALTGIAGLPLSCRPAIRAAALIYREIGREVARNGFDSISVRAVTDNHRKIELLAYGSLTPFPLVPVSTAPTDPSVAFLVEAAASARGPAPPRTADAKFGRLLELMARSAEHERMGLALSREAR
ncbi:MAG: phytoene/squalene synthase family protein [Pseudomonadota bacterium]